MTKKTTKTKPRKISAPTPKWNEWRHYEVSNPRVVALKAKLPAMKNVVAFYANNVYYCEVFALVAPSGPMLHLCIGRRDGKNIFPWHDLQKIKNLVLGERVEAIEVYPDQANLIDDAHMRHLWVLSQRLDFGLHLKLEGDLGGPAMPRGRLGEPSAPEQSPSPEPE